MKKHLIIALTTSLAFLWLPLTRGQTLGQWDFSKSNLVQSAGSTLGDIQLTDGVGGPTDLGTVFASTAVFGIPSINSTNAVVMRFPAATNGQGYLMPTPATANDGGTLVNEWTLIMDLLYPAVSDKQLRPLIDTDYGLMPDPDFVISTTDGLGATPSGPYGGSIQTNTWYRIGISVTTNEVDTYINGAQVGVTAGKGLDGRFAFTPGSPVLILASSETNAAVGYVKSIQLRTNALNAGQMQALGGPSAAGILQKIPPVPSFIQSRLPRVSDQNVLPEPQIAVILNQGDTTIDPTSISLSMDGTLLPTTLTNTSPTFGLGITLTNPLAPSSVHTLTLAWHDSVAGSVTNSWSFTVYAYQSVTLPTPFYFENFDELAEGALPTGWIATNATVREHTTFDFCDPNSEAYENWVVINTNRLCGGGPCSGFECDTLYEPPIALNGSLIGSLGISNILYFESDNRCGSCYGQIGMLFTADINCTGRTNVFVSWNSLYLQNQNNIASLEYSIDQGTNWLPVIYYLPITDGTDFSNTDVIKTNGVVDINATFIQPNHDGVAGGTNWAYFIAAPVTTNLIPYIRGLPDDEASYVITAGNVVNNKWIGKEIETVRLGAADGQKTVRFRFMYAGTCSWFWGVDNFGLYEINTPTFVSQPQNQTVAETTTATFTVVAAGPPPLSYHWQHAGTNLINGGRYSGVTNATLTISNVSSNDAGAYTVIVSNPDGPSTSQQATLTVIGAPLITSQPATVVVYPGSPATFSVTAIGRPVLSYQWLKGGSPVGLNSPTLSIPSAQQSDAGSYQVSITNTDGSVLSTVARLVVSPSSITNSLVVHLKFDGDYTDSSGRTNNATAVAAGSAPDAGPIFATGKIGKALQFTTKQDGTVIDYATLGYPADLKFVDSVDFSISLWTDYSLQVDDPPFISNKNWDSSGNKGWGIFTQNSGHFRANVTGTAGSKYDISSSVTPLVRDGTWHHILMSYARGGPVSMYVDGNLIDSRTDLTSGTIDTDDLGYSVNIGQDGRGTYTDGGSAGITNALIDDLGIWRRALSAPEATAIYSAGQAGKDLSQAQVSAVPSRPTLKITVSGSNLQFSWQASPTGRLQKTTSLNPANWADVAGTTGTNVASVTLSGGGTAFFRVAQ
jgi:hypothetical protein